MSQTAECPSLLNAISPVVTWSLVVLGWLIINRQHNTRETRKELRSQLDQVCKEIADVERKATNYHLELTCNRELGREIKIRLKRLGRSLKLLNFGEKRTQSHRFVRFRQAITLKNFDTAHHEQQQLDGKLLDEVAVETENLVFFLEEEFAKKYKILKR